MFPSLPALTFPAVGLFSPQFSPSFICLPKGTRDPPRLPRSTRTSVPARFETPQWFNCSPRLSYRNTGENKLNFLSTSAQNLFLAALTGWCKRPFLKPRVLLIMEVTGTAFPAGWEALKPSAVKQFLYRLHGVGETEYLLISQGKYPEGIYSKHGRDFLQEHRGLD